MMYRFVILALVASLSRAELLYELSGEVHPEGIASITLFGATHPDRKSVV